MPQIHAHPLEVVAAIIATEGLPPQTIVAPISIIGETTAPRLRRASHISPFTMLVSFVCGWISMPASDDHGAPGAGSGQDFRRFVSAIGLQLPFEHIRWDPSARDSPPSRHPRPPRRRRRPRRPPVAVAVRYCQAHQPAADHHGHGHHAGRAGRREGKYPSAFIVKCETISISANQFFLSKSVNGTSNEGLDRDEKHPQNGKWAKPAWGPILACQKAVDRILTDSPADSGSFGQFRPFLKNTKKSPQNGTLAFIYGVENW